ncbi:hypothetical protein BST81_05515 [Leptolyngbya sp. 'hensonii']|uniref:hypothetical protein n=1 Tax=Leptolyngbya sp. 'hensonii' TaxID=1922337 RepID=UPI00094FE493|nr:hypothetical protein [Leptolyngbya sp. 'hensonii']OLP19225.1 hypothetical protein BST81_05515 [Leptolyngbya sp. 'hensonii']
MRKRSLLAIMGVLALVIGGCGGEESPPTASSPSPEAASPSPTASTPAKPEAKPDKGGSFDKPIVVAAKPTAPGLIQSTPAEERILKLQKGRKDPFATLPNVVPVLLVPKNPDGTPIKASGNKTVPGVKGLPNVKPSPNNPPVTPGTTGTRPGVRRPGGTLPGGASSPVATAPPPPPEPTTARAVVVTGVITVGNESQAIVQAPDEPTSRNVRIGQRLSNGQVLVKRIDNTSEGPIVILEQYGVEVAKSVGEPPAVQPGQPAQPTS